MTVSSVLHNFFFNVATYFFTYVAFFGCAKLNRSAVR